MVNSTVCIVCGVPFTSYGSLKSFGHFIPKWQCTPYISYLVIHLLTIHQTSDSSLKRNFQANRVPTAAIESGEQGLSNGSTLKFVACLGEKLVYPPPAIYIGEYVCTKFRTILVVSILKLQEPE